MKITKRQLRALIRESLGDWIPGVEGENEKAEREEEERIAEKHPSAFQMYKALKGAGTDEKAVRNKLEQVGQIDQLRSTMQALVHQFDVVAKSRGDEGDLVEWLRADGMDLEASIVEYVTKGVIRK
jgi:uncharacterized protein (UPF0335 family)